MVADGKRRNGNLEETEQSRKGLAVRNVQGGSVVVACLVDAGLTGASCNVANVPVASLAVASVPVASVAVAGVSVGSVAVPSGSVAGGAGVRGSVVGGVCEKTVDVSVACECDDRSWLSMEIQC